MIILSHLCILHLWRQFLLNRLKFLVGDTIYDATFWGIKCEKFGSHEISRELIFERFICLVQFIKDGK